MITARRTRARTLKPAARPQRGQRSTNLCRRLRCARATSDSPIAASERGSKDGVSDRGADDRIEPARARVDGAGAAGLDHDRRKAGALQAE